MTEYATFCFFCKHFKERAVEPTETHSAYVCSAFPKGIPDDLLLGTHLEVVPGQSENVTYEPDDAYSPTRESLKSVERPVS